MNKRITYIHQHYLMPNEGGAMRGWEFTRRLAQDGYKVTVIRGRAKDKSGIFDGVKVVNVGTLYSNEMSIPRRLLAFLQFTMSATILAVRTPTDLVFATSTPLTVAIPGIIASFVKRVPFVFEVRDLWPSVPVQLGYIKNPLIIQVAKILEKVTYRRAKRIIALSPGMSDGVIEVDPNAKVSTIPNAADIELFEPLKPSQEKLRLDFGWEQKVVALYVGSFGDIYNIPWLIEFAAQSRGFADFQFIGKGKSTEEATRLAIQAGFDSEKLLPGSMPKTEAAKRVVAADICISSVINHPSLEPASINKVFDAMAAGKPILFNHDGWLTDICVEEGAGWRLPNDPHEAAQVLKDIIRDPENLVQAAKASRKLAERFSRESLYTEFKQVLLDAVDE